MAGGDGTINEALNGVACSDVALGILPVGTANVLALELGLAHRAVRVAESIPEFVAERISVGLLTPRSAPPRYFLLMAGVGLDATVVANVDLELKKRIGRLAYWIGGFGQLGRHFPQFDVSGDGGSLRSSFTLASRVRNYGRDIRIARTACLLDDYLELVSFEGEDSFRYLKYLTGALADRLHKMEGVSIRKVRRVQFTPPPDAEIHVQVDGEFAGKLPATVEVVPDALTLLMPASVRQKYAEYQALASIGD